MTRGRHGFYAVPENGPAARSVAPDAHRCIMVQAPPEGLPNTSVLGRSPDGELPSDLPIPLLLHLRRSTRNRKGDDLTIVAPYKPALAEAGVWAANITLRWPVAVSGKHRSAPPQAAHIFPTG